MFDFKYLTRFEVIDHRAKQFPEDQRGRVFAVQDDVTIELSYQDDNRTLKVFINDK
jgi:hypothetical protein